MHEHQWLNEWWPPTPCSIGLRLTQCFDEFVDLRLQQPLRMLERIAAAVGCRDKVACVTCDASFVSLELDQKAARRTGNE